MLLLKNKADKLNFNTKSFAAFRSLVRVVCKKKKFEIAEQNMKQKTNTPSLSIGDATARPATTPSSFYSAVLYLTSLLERGE